MRKSSVIRIVPAAILIAAASAVCLARTVVNPRDLGAAGDGKTLDTAAINEAVKQCCRSGPGIVRFSPGRYLTGTIRLRSNVTLQLEKGAAIVGTPNLDAYQYFTPPANTPEARFGKWHSALILGVDVNNVSITGPGTIDGNKVFNPRGEEKMRGPHTIIFGDSSDITIADLKIKDSANYAVMIEFTDNVTVRNVEVTGGWDGVHFRGWTDNPCRNITIRDCRFFTGDDSIAGRYAENLNIRECVINSSCNGIRIIGPVAGMQVRDCNFYGPGLHPHRTSDRNNMLSGIILQPGGWDACPGPLKNVCISDVTMTNVASPVAVMLKRPGNTVEDVAVSSLTATGVYRAAASVESWTDTPCGRVSFTDCTIQYTAGKSTSNENTPARVPGVDCRPLPAWAFYARNATDVILRNVRLIAVRPDRRPAISAENLDHLTLQAVELPESATPTALANVRKVTAP